MTNTITEINADTDKLEMAHVDTDFKNHNFTIINLAITILDLEKGEPLFAEKCTKLNRENHKVFYEFFEKHINETRNGKKTLECKFLDRDNDIFSKITRYKNELDDASFLNLANQVSRKLFLIMRTATKSSGSFFIIHALFNEEELIILIKLDPIDAVQLDMDSLELKKIENILPDSNDRVHKCAIIKTNYNPNGTNLFVLDKQQKVGETSQFFMETFLQATQIPNDKIKTKLLINELFEKISPNFDEDEKLNLSYAIDSELANKALVHIPTAVYNVFEKVTANDVVDRKIFIEEKKDEFVNNFNKKYPDFSPNLMIERDDINYVYKALNNKILFKYNRTLANTNVFVKSNEEKTEYTITIKNDKNLKFKLT
ncbi:nucleoid-associated protein [Solibacillus silvestris]